VGGCCGTSFAHLKAMREALDSHRKAARPTVADVVARIGPLRNKAANESGANAEGGSRRERRRARA
ncbi:MAG: methionine synthase, partial [Rhizobiaceae bacterium]